MNEFYKPDRQEKEREAANTQTRYAEPENIRIVVDNDAPPRQSAGNVESPYMNGRVDLEKFRGASADQVIGNFSPSSGTYNTDTQAAAQANTAPSPQYSYDPGKYIPREAGFSNKVKNKYVSLLLCFLFGYLGVHRFYEGKIGTGILWAFTGGLAGIGWFVDLIILLSKPHYYEP